MLVVVPVMESSIARVGAGLDGDGEISGAVHSCGERIALDLLGKDLVSKGGMYSEGKGVLPMAFYSSHMIRSICRQALGIYVGKGSTWRVAA